MNQTRISVFLDGSNFFFMQKDALGWFCDPKKILDYIESYGTIVDAFYYIGTEGPSAVKQDAFLRALPQMGYSLVTKPIKTIFDASSGKKIRKSNLDIEIALDMFNTIDNYDKAVLISGDGDFERALRLLKARGKQFLVVATEQFVARELRDVAGRHFIDLANIREHVEKAQRSYSDNDDE
ncbi:MAG: NYN domain-containing protein [Cryomorphaceae bacterium]|nr:MAG: NYN domain-containing protein [Cryomorphaceae bacterium]